MVRIALYVLSVWVIAAFGAAALLACVGRRRPSSRPYSQIAVREREQQAVRAAEAVFAGTAARVGAYYPNPTVQNPDRAPVSVYAPVQTAPRT